MKPTPVDVPGLLPVVPRGADATRLVTALSQNGTYGTLDVTTKQWVPAVCSTPAAANKLALPGRPVGPMACLAAVQPALAVVNVGLGLFNGVMSWKMNGKLNSLLEQQGAMAAQFDFGFAKLRSAVVDMGFTLQAQHQQVLESLEAIHEEQLLTEAVELLSRQMKVLERGRDLADARILRRAEALDGAAEDLRAYVVATMLVRTKIPQARLALDVALVQALVARSDAELVYAEKSAAERQHHLGSSATSVSGQPRWRSRVCVQRLPTALTSTGGRRSPYSTVRRASVGG